MFETTPIAYRRTDDGSNTAMLWIFRSNVEVSVDVRVVSEYFVIVPFLNRSIRASPAMMRLHVVKSRRSENHIDI